MHDTGRIRSGDVEIFYRLWGKGGAGLPALAVHGLSYFSWDWIGIGDRLGVARPFAAMDMRGFGESSWSPSRDYAPATMARDVIAVVDALQWRKVVLIGHSMGGRNCALAAAENPGAVAGLVLVDYTPANAAAGSRRVAESVAGVPDAFASVAAAMRHFGSTNRARFEAYLQPVPGGLAPKRDTFFRDQFRRIRDTGERPALPVDLWQVVAGLACPVLVLRGTGSDLFGPESVERYRALQRPNLRLVELAGGHDIPGENPDGLVREVALFLEHLEAAQQ